MSTETEQRELTFGEKLVGVDFNPSALPRVKKLKALFAEAADIVHERMLEQGEDASAIDSMTAGMAYGDIKRACMAAVANVTNKH